MSAIDDLYGSFDHWEGKARWALAERGIGYHRATPFIEEARGHHAAAGGDAREVLGAPEQFAADVAAANPELLAGRDAEGKTPYDHLTDGLFVVATFGVLIALLGAWANRGLTMPLVLNVVVGAVVLVLAFLAVISAPGALRAAGHPRLAPWAFAVAGVLGAAGFAALVLLPETRIGSLPVLLLGGVSLFACWRLTQPDGKPVTDSAPAAPGPAETDPSDSHAWFVRLHAVLVGRFDVPSERAAELVAETRAHVTEAGVRPSEEFPSIDAYARELAAGEPVRKGPWWRSRTAARIGTVVLFGWWLYLLVEAVVERNWWLIVFGLLAAPLAVTIVRRQFRA
ncbi:hypothetical protein AB0F81_04490 [Actinoplanes sp. NPDC024001]|uniref:hypothetical protein n=1 Tax=Actinoplanes sp. NPDC024001 TaxID=3154598 RepID=UPI0033EA939B